jgi:hypothetical protein
MQLQKDSSGVFSLNIHNHPPKWIKDLNLKPEAMKLPQENIGETLQDIVQAGV